MSFIKWPFLFFLAFSQFSATLAFAEDVNCSESLRINPQSPHSDQSPKKSDEALKKIVSESALVENFRKSSSLIFDSRNPRSKGMVQGGHLMSNELDIFKLPQVLPQRDLFFGIGNNASWDIALRSGAKKIIFYDINYEPLILQRYFFRPLFEISESPADFYKYLFLKVSEKHLEKTTLKHIEEFDIWEDFAWFEDKFVDPPMVQRQKLREEFLRKIREKSTDPEKDFILEFVQKFQESFSNEQINLFPDSRGSSYEAVLELFGNRYFPTNLKRLYSLSEKDAEGLYEGNVTFLSSPENFQKMKSLILNADYVVTSIESNFWPEFTSRFPDLPKEVTLYTSNILDVYAHILSREKITSQFVESFKGSKSSAVLIESRGMKSHHTYHVEELK